MKKFLLLTLAALFLLCAACAEEAALPVFAWERNAADHWQLDESGAIINQSAHTISEEDLRCTVCGCELLDWGDGTFDVTDYDEYGNLLHYTYYENDVVLYDSVHALTCNEDGVVLKDVEYINGVLYGESVYTVNENSDQIPVTQTAWNDDGTTSTNFYDEHGNCIRSAIFEADGTVSFEELTEYALNEDGWYYEAVISNRFATGELFYEDRNEYGDVVRTYHTDENGTITADWTHEYLYEDGRKVWAKQYLFGEPTWEEYYHEDGYLEMDVEILEDGGKVVTTYNEEGDELRIVTFAADGSVISEE